MRLWGTHAQHCQVHHHFLCRDAFVRHGGNRRSSPGDTDKATETPDNVTTGSVYVEPTVEQRMADCMAIWEPATHMTKQQWRRTCKMSLKELSSQ